MNVRTINSLCYLVLAFLGIYIAAFQRILDVMAINFSLTKVLMGAVITAHFIGAFLSPLVAGELSDKYGRGKVITASFLALFAGVMAIFLSNGLIVLLIGVFLAGSGFSVLESTVTALLTDVTPDNSNKTIGISQVFFGIGAAVGPFIAAFSIMKLNSWRYFYLLCVILIFVFTIIFIRYPYPKHTPVKEETGIISFKLLSNKLFLLFCISIILYVGIEEGIAFWITTYMKGSTDSIYFQSVALSAFWASMIVGRYVVSRFSDKLNEIIIGSSVISLVFLIVALNIQSLMLEIVAFLGLGLGLSGIWPIIMALVQSNFPKTSGTAFGIMLAGCALGGAIIPYVMGFIAQISNLKYALAFCIIPFIVIIAIHVIIIRRSNNYQNTAADITE